MGKVKFFGLYFILMFSLTSCASMVSGLSFGSILSRKSVTLCPEERQAIIEEAVKEAVDTIKKDQQKSYQFKYFNGF